MHNDFTGLFEELAAELAAQDDAQLRIAVAESRALLLQCADDDGARELYLAKLLLLSGRPDEAGRRCRSFIERDWRKAVETPSMLNTLAETAFRLGDFSAIEAFTTLAHGVACEISVLPKGSVPAGPGVAIWELGDNGPMRFIFDEKLYDHPYMDVLLKHWIQALGIYCHFKRTSDIQQGSIALNLEDMGSIPGLVFCDYRPGYSLLPDPIFMMSNGYADTKATFVDQAVSWQDRVPRAIWRGTTTGLFDCKGDPVRDWRDLPRIKLCQLAARPEAHDLLDAGITGLLQVASEAAAEIGFLGIQQPHVHWAEFQKFKYQIDIDGNSSAWPGLFLKFCSGSVVLKVESSKGFRQWYYDRLIPWHNYVPVEADMSDLLEKIRWLQRRDELSRAIGANGQAMVLLMTPRTETLLSERTIEQAFIDGR